LFHGYEERAIADAGVKVAAAAVAVVAARRENQDAVFVAIDFLSAGGERVCDGWSRSVNVSPERHLDPFDFQLANELISARNE
jgi:hypothetical protein